MHNTALHWAADNGRLLLVAGLVAGISLPGLAGLMRDYLAHMIALLLFLNAFRIGTSATLGTQGQMKKAFVLVLVMQLLIPCLFILLFRWLEFAGPIATALVIMTAASSISGAPNITSLLGHQPAVSQRLLILGTVLLPVTILPVFLLSETLDAPGLVAETAFRLVAVIGISAGLAYCLRARFFKKLAASQLKNVDGISVIVMSVVVIGLMSALGPALVSEPVTLVLTVLTAFGVNYGLQVICYFCLSAESMASDRVGISVVAGNRNMALFLAALPAQTTDPILLFIACYQLPMYLTPVLLRRFYSATG